MKSWSRPIATASPPGSVRRRKRFAPFDAVGRQPRSAARGRRSIGQTRHSTGERVPRQSRFDDSISSCSTSWRLTARRGGQVQSRAPAHRRSGRVSRPAARPALLGKLAQTTGGTVIHHAEELASLLGRHKDADGSDDRHPLARRGTPPCSGSSLGLLSAEWILRRIKGLA